MPTPELTALRSSTAPSESKPAAISGSCVLTSLPSTACTARITCPSKCVWRALASIASRRFTSSLRLDVVTAADDDAITDRADSACACASASACSSSDADRRSRAPANASTKRPHTNGLTDTFASGGYRCC